MKVATGLLPWLWAWLITLVGLVALVSEAIVKGRLSYAAVAGVAVALLFTFLGTLIAVRRPGNRIAWLLVAVGFGLLISGATSVLITTEPESPSLVHHVGLVVDNWGGLSLFFYPIILILYVFPTGEFFSRRQAWVGWLGAVMVPANLLVAMFVTEIGPSFQDEEKWWRIESPVGVLPPEALDVMLSVWGLGLVPLAFGGIWSLSNRYRKSEEVVRAQIRWMLLSSLLLAVAFVVVVISPTDSIVSGVLLSVAVASIPVSITIAITRYRLFEIDRIISRTLTYLLVIGGLGVVFVTSVTLVSSLVPSSNSLAVAASTLAAAGLFNPLRTRVQDAVDRRFNRAGYEAEVVSRALGQRLQDSMDPDEIAWLWIGTVNHALQPDRISVWLNGVDAVPSPEVRAAISGRR